MRHVCGLPSNCLSAVIQILSAAFPSFDTICQRAVMFVKMSEWQL